MNDFNFDSQLLKDYANCEAAGIARHVHGLRSRKEKIAADIGNAYHAALQAHFSGSTAKMVVDVLAYEYDQIVPPGEQPEEARFERGNCLKIMERYCEVRPYPGQFPFEVVELEKVKGIEIEPGFVFWTKQDLKVVAKQTGQYSPVDHKTTRALTDWFARRYRLTSQMSGYTWFTQQETGQVVGLSYINGIEIKKLPDSNKKCPTHKVLYSECGREHANFQLYQYVRSPEQLEKWKQDALQLAKRVQLLSQAFADINALPYALRNGAFNESCMFCEYGDWCKDNFAPHMAGEYCVYERWAPWEREDAVRVDRQTVQTYHHNNVNMNTGEVTPAGQ